MGNSAQSKPTATPERVIAEFNYIEGSINTISDMTTHLRENIQVYCDGFNYAVEEKANFREFIIKARHAERILVSTSTRLEKQVKTVASESKAETIGTRSMRNQMLSTTLVSFAECEMDFYNALVTYNTAVRDDVRKRLKIVNPHDGGGVYFYP